MKYGTLISQAWKTTWRYKALWLFAILMTELNYLFQLIQPDFPQGQSEGDAVLGYGIFFISFMITIFLFLYQYTGMIRGVYIATEVTPDKLSLKDIFREIPPRLWKVTKLFLVIFSIIVLSVIVLFIINLVFSVTGAVGEILALSLSCLLVPVTVAFGVVIYQVMIALVVDDLAVPDALQKGWGVFRKHYDEFFVIVLILIIISVALLIVIGVPFVIATSTHFNNLIAYELGSIDQFTDQMPGYLRLFGFFYTLLGAVVSVFVLSVQVNAYLEFTGRPNWKLPPGLKDSPANDAGPA